VRHVRGVEPAQAVAAELEHLAVGERPRGTAGDVVHRHHRGDLAAHRLGLARGGEEVVERAAFVGLVVREGDVAQVLQRQHVGDRFGHQREHAARAGVE
jgi:hypothetical protein